MSEKKRAHVEEDMRMCTETQHSVWFPELDPNQPKKGFYGDERKCMACSDYRRLQAVKEERGLPPGAIDRYTVAPTFSIESIEQPPSVLDAATGRRLCLHPLHGEWFFESASNPVLASEFDSNEDKVCRGCVRVNSVLNRRQQARQLARMQMQTMSSTPTDSGSGAGQLVKKPKKFRSDGSPSESASKPSKRPDSSSNNNHGSSNKAAKTAKGNKVAAADPSWPPLLDEQKARVCVGCEIEYVFFPDHPLYNELPEAWVCNNCIDKVACFGCGVSDTTRDHEMIMCDGCLLRGAHFSCLGLDAVPEGNWYCVDCVWGKERELLGSCWVCKHCSNLNHTRWQPLSGICMECRETRQPADAAELWKPVRATFSPEESLPAQEDVALWTVDQIASFAWRFHYARLPPTAPVLPADKFTECLRAAGGDALLWLDGLAGAVMDRSDLQQCLSWLREAAEWLVKKWIDATEQQQQLPPRAAKMQASERLKSSASPQIPIRTSSRRRDAWVVATATVSSPSSSHLDGRAGAALKADLGTPVSSRKVIPKTPEVDGECMIFQRPHGLLRTAPPARFCGALVWATVDASREWNLAQLYVDRDIPAEFTREVLGLHASVGARSPALVLFFGAPRTFGWVIPEDGELALFRDELRAHYIQSAAAAGDTRALNALLCSTEILSAHALPLMEPKSGWITIDSGAASPPQEVGTLVWARLKRSDPWWPATISTALEVPADLLDQVVATKKGDDALVVLFFDVPTNRFAYVSRDAHHLVHFRAAQMGSYLAHVTQIAAQKPNDVLVQCTRRALLFETVYVPSKEEGARWMCLFCVATYNHPYRDRCVVCHLSKGSKPVRLRAEVFCEAGGATTRDVRVIWLNCTMRLMKMEGGYVEQNTGESRAHALYDQVVFGQAAPQPFLALRSVDGGRWTVMLLKDAAESTVLELRKCYDVVPAMKHAVVHFMVTAADCERVLGNAAIFSNPLLLCGDA